MNSKQSNINKRKTICESQRTENYGRWTHLCTQCAADNTQNFPISTPPHQCPMKPYKGCSNSRDVCHGKSPSFVGSPNIIFGFRVVAVMFSNLLLKFSGLAIYSKKF